MSLTRKTLGTLKNRSVFTPLFSAFGPEPIKARIDIARARVLVTTASLYSRKIEPLRREKDNLGGHHEGPRLWHHACWPEWLAARWRAQERSHMVSPDNEDLRMAARSDVAVLVTAENAANRVEQAQFIHNHSARHEGPFVVLDRADTQRSGKAALERAFDRARGGTLFIDDVATIDAGAQAALFTLLDDNGSPQGGGDVNATRAVRIITGARGYPLDAVTSGAFSDRLLYRLNVIHVNSCDL